MKFECAMMINMVTTLKFMGAVMIKIVTTLKFMCAVIKRVLGVFPLVKAKHNVVDSQVSEYLGIIELWANLYEPPLLF